MRKRNKLICGIGVNDADYSVYKKEKINGSLKTTWVCPFYSRWKHMIERAYSDYIKKQAPSYENCHVTPEWHYFMTFRAWMETQDWQDKQLDKDLLFPENREYSPYTCIFVTREVNSFMTEKKIKNSNLPTGVHYDKNKGYFRASGRDVVSKKNKFLGSFLTPEEAHCAWLEFKYQQAILLSSWQIDERVATALIERYKI